MNSYLRETSPKKLARIAGILYLLIIVLAGFSEGVVRSSIIVHGDAAATAGNILKSEMLFRIGFVSDLIAFMSDLAVSILLYVLLKPVNHTLSLMAAAFRLVAHPAIAGLNLLNQFSVLTLVSGAGYLSAFETEQLQALVLYFLNTHHSGYLIGGAFFGIHLLLLGYLVFKSDYLPRLIGIFLLVAGCGYLIESFGNFLFPYLGGILIWFVAIPAIIAEVSLTGWLITKGVRINVWNSQLFKHESN